MRQIENGETVECHITILEADTCHDARANQSPPTAFLTASPHRPNHQHKAERSELHFLLPLTLLPSYFSPLRSLTTAASCGNCRPFFSISPWLPFIALTFHSCQSRALTHLNVLFPTSPLFTFLYIHYFQIWSEPRRYNALYINLPSISSWTASLPKSESFAFDFRVRHILVLSAFKLYSSLTPTM
jgi:hypothetical protein